MHVLSCKAPYLRFSNAGGALFTRLSFLPKVPTKVTHPALSLCQQCITRRIGYFADCVRCTLSEYLWRTSDVRQQGTTQLFVPYGGQDKGKSISKQQLSKWVVECIKFSCEKHTDHQTCKMAVTYVDSRGANTCTFANFYRLDAVANSEAEFGRRVLILASSSTSAPPH